MIIIILLHALVVALSLCGGDGGDLFVLKKKNKQSKENYLQNRFENEELKYCFRKHFLYH
ncbi:hypothetical protein QTP88_024351 [Uroleucon formosanum]